MFQNAIGLKDADLMKPMAKLLILIM